MRFCEALINLFYLAAFMSEMHDFSLLKEPIR